MTQRALIRAGVAAALALTALLSGCSGSPGGDALVGSWGSTDTGKPNLTIEGDGAFSGTDGCNRLSGKGTIDGDTITFGDFASTLMACEGVDEWLNKAAKGTADGNSLTVYDQQGDKLGTLDKSD